MGTCSGCSKQGSCSSEGQGSCPEEKLQKTISKIKHKIVVLSGKGGVGKSTVAVNLAVGLALEGKKVGLLDVDVHGPSVPRLLSLKQEKPHMEKSYMEPVPWTKNLWVMSLGFLLPSEYEAVIWRGPVKMGLIKQFLEDVAWGELDYLIVDCPPGTGDEPLSVLQLLGQEAKCLIVTTPQGVAVDDVRRSVTFCNQLGNSVLGIVENMSGFICPKCGERTDVFFSGGGESLAQEMKVPFLAKIPLDPEVVRSGEEGYVYIKTHPDSASGKEIKKVVQAALNLG
ncbi:MAG: Mrp/NBP35 family ATP-binding protein [Desulfonauticus sp.]|nr:Mrp/NBP35 family ATP-binding protein [Desulfonauticus sp.]